MSVDPDHEMAVECVACGQHLIVGGFIDDIDPHLYRCGECRPLKPHEPTRRPQTTGRARPDTLTAAMRAAQDAAGVW